MLFIIGFFFFYYKYLLLSYLTISEPNSTILVNVTTHEKNDGYVKFSIHDQSKGIAERDQKYFFYPDSFSSSYYNTNESGIDINLTRNIIDAHRGIYGCISRFRTDRDISTGCYYR